MKPVISVFFDGLKPESLQHMPFLNAIPHHRRLETILGYSITCHASMYTGVYPDRHKLWFLWQIGKQTSPFKWLQKVPLKFLADNIPGWMIAHKITARRSHLTAYWGIPRLFNLPLRYWPEIDVAEKRYWDEDNYIEGCSTIFEQFRKYNIPYEVVGMVPHVVATSEVVAQHQFTQVQPWTYLFIGDVDALTHHFTQEAPEVIARLHEFDQIVKNKCREVEKIAGGYDIIVWSDHGHVRLNEKIDIYNIFRKAGDNLNKHMHLIDINFARFWFKDEEERRSVERILSTISNGHILGEAEMRKEHVLMGDNRFGDLVYYLDTGSAFSRTIFGFGLRQKSIHGYLPSHSECDGIFLSTREISLDIDKVRLVDIQPSLMDMFGLPVPEGLDGKVIWSD